MKNVIILGASGNIAKHVIDILTQKEDVNLTLFVRNKSRLKNKDISKCRIIEGDVLDFGLLKKQLQDRIWCMQIWLVTWKEWRKILCRQ